jgi:glycosyltransferase involved in cell wall biosynthesis
LSNIESSIIICAYNEEKTVVDVVRACRELNQRSEIIVVDDGSVDSTPALLTDLEADLSFRYERFPVNRGKSWAMAHGVAIASKEIILFVDADVSNLRKEHFDSMLEPLHSGTADMVLGQPSQTAVDYRIIPFLRSLTGERALFRKDIIPILGQMGNTRFGVETLINLYFQAQGKRIEHVLLEGLVHPNKYEKTDPLRASQEFIGEGKEIAVTLVKNYGLVAKRVELILKNASARSRRKVAALHEQVNDKIDEFIDRLSR